MSWVLLLGVFFNVVLCGLAGPFPLAPPLGAVPQLPVVPLVAPVVPPFVPGARPIVPGLPGFNNPYYNQYNRVAGATVPILTYSNEHNLDGSYSFSFSTADGKQAQETGYLRDAYIDNAGEPQGTQVVQGSYAYISPEGTPIQVNYIADENGFRPSGVHIPADGKAAAIPIIDKEKQVVDPFNRYDPYNYRNRYYPGRVNNNIRPYDPRYPYEAAKYNPLYNNPYLPPTQNVVDPKVIPAKVL